MMFAPENVQACRHYVRKKRIALRLKRSVGIVHHEAGNAKSNACRRLPERVLLYIVAITVVQHPLEVGYPQPQEYGAFV